MKILFISHSAGRTGAPINLLHLIRDIDAELTRVHALLKPGGVFISKTICSPLSWNAKFTAMMGLARVFQLFNPGLYVRIEPIARWDKRFEDAGFETVETGNFPNDPPRRFIVARKRG